jgi:hypothetical protein
MNMLMPLEDPAPPITEEQQEALGAVARTISEKATDAFTKLLGTEVTAEVPELEVLPLSEAVERLGRVAARSRPDRGQCLAGLRPRRRADRKSVV